MSLGEYMNMNTWKELKPYPNHKPDEDTIRYCETNTISEQTADSKHFSNATVNATVNDNDLWPNEYENMRPDHLPKKLSSKVSTESNNTPEGDAWELCVPVGFHTYDPLNNLLMKYKQDPSQFYVMCSLFQTHAESDLQRGQGLLPPRDIHDDRKTLVLDMDETLIHCSFHDEQSIPCDWMFSLESGGSMTDVFCRVRPHLEKFLRVASMMFEIVVFTASQENYANKVLDFIDPTGYIEHRLFRQHCTQVHGYYVKDLSLLGRPLRDTVIIDNSPISFAFQPMNGILCDDWSGNPSDFELLQLIPILQQLDLSMDLRQKLWEISYVGHFLFELCEALSGNELWRMREEDSGL